MCTNVSRIQAFSKKHFSREEWPARMGYAESHLKRCTVLYVDRMKAETYFMHEHPHGALSWQLPCMKHMSSLPGVQLVTVDLC